VVCIADNVIPHEKRPGDKQLTRYFIKPVDRFVVMSEQVKDDLRQFTAKQSLLLPHPLYDNFGEKITKLAARLSLKEKFGIQISAETPLLVFFGLVRHYKGLDLLLDSLSKNRNKQVQLLVAGEFYEDQKPYVEQIKNLNLHNRVQLHAHFIQEGEVKYFICSADCIIQPYRSATQSGVTPVAYHFEIPMIVTNVGGLPQMVPHGKAGIVCEADSNSIAEAIDLFFETDPETFKAGLLQEKQNLSWAAFTNGILKLAAND
jgi:glycosyltransferase involved in cell wall biosynthesis